MSDEECIQLLTKYWIYLFALDEKVNDEENHEIRQKRINDFKQLCEDAVNKGEGVLMSRNIMNHNGGEGYLLKLILTKIEFTPEEQEKYLGIKRS